MGKTIVYSKNKITLGSVIVVGFFLWGIYLFIRADITDGLLAMAVGQLIG